MTKKVARPNISQTARQLLATYEHHLTDVLDLSPATIRNYISDLRLFMAWCEQTWEADGTEASFGSTPWTAEAPETGA